MNGVLVQAGRRGRGCGAVKHRKLHVGEPNVGGNPPVPVRDVVTALPGLGHPASAATSSSARTGSMPSARVGDHLPTGASSRAKGKAFLAWARTSTKGSL